MISNDTSLLVGDAALLACVGFGEPNVEITWKRDGAVIMNSSLVTITEEEVTQGGRVYNQSFLELCSLMVSASYTCSVSIGQTMVNATTQLTVERILELVMISNDTSLLVGDAALLACVGFGEPNVEITWKRNGEVITNSSLVTITEEEVTQGGRVYKQSFLELCSLMVSDAGVYTCSVSNGETMVNATTQLTVECKKLLFQK